MSRDTLGQENTPKSLDAIKKHLKDGEEPVEVLHGLVASPLIDLQNRGLAMLWNAEKDGRKIVLAILYDAEWTNGKIESK